VLKNSVWLRFEQDEDDEGGNRKFIWGIFVW